MLLFLHGLLPPGFVPSFFKVVFPSLHFCQQKGLGQFTALRVWSLRSSSRGWQGELLGLFQIC